MVNIWNFNYITHIGWTKMNIISWLEKNKKAVYWIAGILVALLILFPDNTIELGNKSIFGIQGTLVSFSLVLFIIGIFLIIIPTPVTTIAGVIISGVSLFIGGASIFNLLGSFGSLASLIIFGIIGLLLIRKITK